VGIEKIVKDVNEEFKLYEFKSFVLVNGNRYYVMYFEDKRYDNPNQLNLFGDDVWNSLKKKGYEK
jgi:hypothetical protein